MRLAQVVRTAPRQQDEAPRGTIVIELLDARVRITAASDTDRAMLVMVLELLAPVGPDACATVRLTPFWFAWLFGARPELVDLVATERWHDGSVRWRSAATGRDLRDLRYGALIREALERRPVGEVPAAIARPTPRQVNEFNSRPELVYLIPLNTT